MSDKREIKHHFALPLHPEDMERFWRNVLIPDNPDGCWLWTGDHFNNGYPRFGLDGWQHIATRVAYAVYHGKEADGFVCHTCDTPLCVKPMHLWDGDHTENMRDMVSKHRHFAMTHPELIRRGTDSPFAILTEEQVIQIRHRYDAGDHGMTAMGLEYGVSPSNIWQIVRRNSWKHLP